MLFPAHCNLLYMHHPVAPAAGSCRFRLSQAPGWLLHEWGDSWLLKMSKCRTCCFGPLLCPATGNNHLDKGRIVTKASVAAPCRGTETAMGRHVTKAPGCRGAKTAPLTTGELVSYTSDLDRAVCPGGRVMCGKVPER